ncbi:glutathione S-transferase family protein [Pseudoalteromonas sp. ASV78]|uniref:glutathione S-transferase family protein n=1 Tax=Pseudoalteromonas sp. ASV78 TaxID=3397851 RepID=UPI0039FCDA2D
MQLLGSTTSPFVRRIRIWALLNHCELEFINLDIFAAHDRQLMIKNNPARKVPVLICKQHTLADSNNIIRFLLELYNHPRLSWQQEHLLSTINGCNDSLVELLLCQRSGFDTTQDKLFFNLQNERIAETLSYLNSHLADAEFKSCEYLCISLYCLLDWICFRELTDLTAHTELMEFYHSFAQQQAVQQTDPRN